MWKITLVTAILSFICFSLGFANNDSNWSLWLIIGLTQAELALYQWTEDDK